MKIFLGYFIITMYVALILSLCHYLHRKLNIQIKYTRKIGHISLSALWPIQYYFFGTTIHMLLPITVFTLINLFAFKFNLFTGIEHTDKNRSYGTIYFTVAMLLLTIAQLFAPDLIFSVGIAYFCLTFGDGLAAIIGYRFQKNNRKLCARKTLFGSLTMWLCSVLVILGFCCLFDINMSLLEVLAIASIACLTELYTPLGFDNITLPIVVTAIVYLVINNLISMPVLVLLGIAPILHFFILLRKIFTPGANVTSLIYMVILTTCLEWMALALVFVPFFLDALIILIKKHNFRRRNCAVKLEEMSGRRASQVLCNGVVALPFAIAYFAFSQPVGLYVSIACIAAAFGDTIASDVGEMSKSPPIDICSGKRIANGLSGGVTILGFCSAAMAIILLEMLLLLWLDFTLMLFLMMFVIAMFGVIIDSVLGSIFQAKYKCAVCQSIIESNIHCGKLSELVKGKFYITNNAVNFISSVLVAFVGSFVFVFLD